MARASTIGRRVCNSEVGRLVFQMACEQFSWLRRFRWRKPIQNHTKPIVLHGMGMQGVLHGFV